MLSHLHKGMHRAALSDTLQDRNYFRMVLLSRHREHDLDYRIVRNT